ncbi:enoyl-CoA hydratase/isomerase family protein [Aquabacter sp. L1I39]|uniref:oxepin-CoA hydrolase, alternative type n=1 Tax=Aquabacter sp. L1I39 TaxID=2820278 RepID=UPI001ADD37B1|nr:enoyl-CoA hydratase family protein [Aquabacter sp. L1I39]QTL03733.1 enoyl-CoA hydratase/isomerase family protein [Aquabacter sp. L1I39]
MTKADPSPTRVDTERRGTVLLITVCGPDNRNAIGPAVYVEVQERLVEAGRDPGVRAIIIAGAGGFFSSGGNVRALKASAAGSPAEAARNTDKLNAMVKAIVHCPKPVVAAVEGGAAGAAVSVVLACDLVVAAREAAFTLAYVRVGLCPDGGATHFLRAALPRQLAMQMCLLGEPVSAERLAQFGLVNKLTDRGEALEAALALAERLAAGPPQAMANIKRLVHIAPDTGLAAQMDLEADALNAARFGAEAAEGLAAFLEKRPPCFADAPEPKA